MPADAEPSVYIVVVALRLLRCCMAASSMMVLSSFLLMMPGRVGRMVVFWASIQGGALK